MVHAIVHGGTPFKPAPIVISELHVPQAGKVVLIEGLLEEFSEYHAN